MNGTVINNLKYTGVVTLSQYIGKKRIVLAKSENAGGPPLFDFLAECLAGNFDVAKVNRPTKIMLLNNVNGELTATGNAGWIWLTTPPEIVSSATGTVRYSFIIGSEDLKANKGFNAIGLYTSSAKKDSLSTAYAALCSIAVDINNLSTSSALLVDWELSIANATK
jgi:hypothetical protein